ncbi:hypothetical protein [Nonomuraea sp. NPDC048826]|uniref:hypothetical protein n=1 Tax=Nonomuraea sp. NPDC048826 TaxID=3364347 RepID=UPI0037209740
MSFGNYARRVRDPALPHPWRVSALRSCVQLYRPLGFEATLSFLESEAGRFRRDEAALLRALDLIEASRAALRTELQAYATKRREAKAQGRRTPRADEANPNFQARWYWYGAPREAALHALRFWRSRRLPQLLPSADPALLELGRCVDECLDAVLTKDAVSTEDAVLTEERRDALGARVRELERHLDSWDRLLVVRHIEVASGLR